MSEPDRAEQGRRGESLAADFLRRNGLTVLRRNCRSKWGEIDLLARDGEAVVFVEVKTRTTAQWGRPEEAVNASKQFKLSMAARAMCDRFKLHGRPLRFDVVAVLADPGRAPEIKHYPNAFPLRLTPAGPRRT